MARGVSTKLSRRQIEVLTCIHLRKHLYGSARFIDLVGDIGVASLTLADHLDALAERGMITPSPYVNRRTLVPTYRYKNNYGIIDLTADGEDAVLTITKDLNIDPNQSRISALKKIRSMDQTKPTYHGLRRVRKSEFSDAFNKLIIENPTEPVISSIGMYTELDSQLGLLAKSNRDIYLELSRTKLNLPIRNGRIASLIIPVALRRQMSANQVAANLEHSWHWFRTVNDNTIDRYVDESSSMGLIEIGKGIIKSCKPGTSGTIEWLASKTISTFLNAVPNIPKAAILTFRESFAYPTREDFLNPNKSGVDLEWAEYVHGSMSNKDLYRDIISDTLKVMVDHANIMIEDPETGRIIPRTILRRLKDAKDLQEAFKSLLSLATDKNPTANLLLIITAKPGVTMDELYHNLTNDKRIFITHEEFADAIRQLVGKGLIHTAATGNQTRLYAFTQIPYIVQKDSMQKNEINAILKGVNPSLLAKIEETMYTEEDRAALQNTIEVLIRDKAVQFDSLDDEYGREFSRKMILLSDYLSPFVETEKDVSGLRVAKEDLSSIVLDISRYSVLTGNEALNQYSTLLSDLVTKDSDFKNKLLSSAQSIETTFLDRGIKMS
ncbi:MAG: hypothetical protein PHN90_02980 [Methanothrix sp.]|jgi:hypothetical protein|nr:hypothetical protein [Methanothrix sp.]NLX38554.1 hypothetical protein [Methanothrix sp.]HPY72455.1 hypothetical protein [Methanothrix sp.]